MHATFTQPCGSLAWEVMLLWHEPQQRKKKPKQKCKVEASKAQQAILWFSQEYIWKSFHKFKLFFFSLTLWILAPVATLPYTGKTAVITLIQIFWGPALSPKKKNNCCFISSFLPPAKETMALRSMTVVSTVKISMLTANYCICDCWSY